MQQFEASTSLLPPRNPWVFDCGLYLGRGGKFEPCLGGVGNLDQNCQVFPDFWGNVEALIDALVHPINNLIAQESSAFNRWILLTIEIKLHHILD